MNRKSIGFISVMALLAVAAVLSVFFYRPLAVEAVYPVENAKRTLTTKVCTRIAGFFRGAAARAENVRLKREIAALTVALGDAERLEAENERLRTALGFAKRSDGKWIAASVLSRNGGAAGMAHTMRLDRGSLSGVRKGAAVTAPEGLVGMVTAVTPHTCEVTTIAMPDVKVSCLVEATPQGAAGERPHTGGALGILEGGTDEALTLRWLRHASALPPRARVLTSGLGGVFPKGIEVGTLIRIREDRQGLSGEGEILPSADLSTLENVFIRNEE